MTSDARAPGAPARDLLSAETLYGIASLDLRARVIAEGVLAGAHRSKRFGSSADFAEHKVYAPGDDLRHLDWKVLAKQDRHYVRRYEDETRLELALVVDTSASMAYAGGARGSFTVSKLETAKTLAAALAFIALARGDATSVSLFAEREVAHVGGRGARGHLAALTEVLTAAQPTGKTDLAGALARVGDRLRQRALVVVISDLVDAEPDALDTLGVLRARGCDAIVLHTLHREELTLPFDGVIRFEDLEGDRVVQLDAPLVRDAYLAELARFLDETRARCARADLRYTLAATDASPVLTLAEALDGSGGASRATAGEERV